MQLTAETPQDTEAAQSNNPLRNLCTLCVSAVNYLEEMYFYDPAKCRDNGSPFTRLAIIVLASE